MSVVPALPTALARFWRQRSRRGKAGIIVAGFLVVAALAGQTPSQPGPSSIANATQSPTETATPSPVVSASATIGPTSEPPAELTAAPVPVVEPTPAPGPVTLLDLKGRGIKNSKTFTTTDAWTLHYTFDCANFGYKGNFQVYLFDGTNLIGILVNELAKKGASSTPDYDIGTFHLEMNSECSWHVRATQP